MDQFELTIRVFSTGRNFRMVAELIHKDQKCMRFKVSAGTKSIIMQKDISLNHIPWKIIEGVFEKVSPADAQDAIRSIGAEIDRWLSREDGEN